MCEGEQGQTFLSQFQLYRRTGEGIDEQWVAEGLCEIFVGIFSEYRYESLGSDRLTIDVLKHLHIFSQTFFLLREILRQGIHEIVIS